MNDLEPAQTPSTPHGVQSKAERARLAREALVGKTIAGRYILRSLLGHGGMGAVYEAEHVGIGKKVAIKFVDPEFVTDEQVLTRFAREARAMSTIESPHIVSIFDAGTEEGRPYLVMELLRGEDLGQRLRRTTRVPLPESLHIIAMVLKGLSKAHAAGIVHRDLKPDNIFLVQIDSDPIFAKIVDFGVSKIERPRNKTSPLALTGRGTVLGTPFYMSPEQAQAIPDLDGRADIFSVGTILFECLSGRPPFTGETYEQVILGICMRDAPALTSIDPSIPPNVSRFVAKALARDRNQRFSTADEMLAALHELSPDEKRRVPADPPLGKTLVAGGSAPVNPNVTAATPTSVKPFRPGATQIAGSAEATAQATPVGLAQATALVGPPSSGPQTPTSGPHAPVVVAPAAPGRSPSHGELDLAGSGIPQRRSSAVIATAVVASLLGVGATFGVISFLDKPSHGGAGTAAGSGAPPSSAVATTAAVGSTSSALALSPIPSADPSASAPAGSVASSAATAPASARAVVGATPPSPKPLSGPGSMPVTAPRPKSSGKALDISRDLP